MVRQLGWNVYLPIPPCPKSLTKTRCVDYLRHALLMQRITGVQGGMFQTSTQLSTQTFPPFYAVRLFDFVN